MKEQKESPKKEMVVAAPEGVSELDARADAIRAHLRGLLSELQTRWHDTFDWRRQLARHPWLVRVGLAASALGAVAGSYRLVQRRQRARRARRFLGLLPRSR